MPATKVDLRDCTIEVLVEGSEFRPRAIRIRPNGSATLVYGSWRGDTHFRCDFFVPADERAHLGRMLLAAGKAGDDVPASVEGYAIYVRVVSHGAAQTRDYSDIHHPFLAQGLRAIDELMTSVAQDSHFRPVRIPEAAAREFQATIESAVLKARHTK